MKIKNNRLVRIMLVLSVLINLALAIFIFVIGKGPAHSPKEMIIKELRFSPEQTKAYETLIFSHRSEIKNKEEKLHTLKNVLYQSISDTNALDNRKMLYFEMNKVHQEIEEIHYHHFEEIYRLCRDHQKVYFQQLLEKLPMIFTPRPPKK